jgi:hypothetical protein
MVTRNGSLSDRLHTTVAFDQATYQLGDTVHLTVTLTNSSTNSSTTSITGVIADCNRINYLNGDDGRPVGGLVATEFRRSGVRGVEVGADGGGLQVATERLVVGQRTLPVFPRRGRPSHAVECRGQPVQ